ncbi:MAG: helix-turn-helix domain-containing protein [Aestuariivirgaceae bacterium]
MQIYEAQAGPCACPTCGAAVAANEFLFSYEEGLVQRRGVRARLTYREADLFYVLMANRGRPVSRSYMIWKVYGQLDQDWPTDKNIDVLIGRMRQKLACLGVQIISVRCRGFMVQIDGHAFQATRFAA